MRLLVTGGDGFIGSNFIHYWFGRHPKDSIVNVDKLTYAAVPSNLDGVGKYDYEFIRGDIADKKLADRVSKDVDAIINFAAETHVDNSIASSERFVHSNVVGVHTLLEASRKHEKRFHHVSTDEVYGALPLHSSRKFDEKSAYKPQNPYSATKAAADHLVNAYFHTYRMKLTISNCSNNLGPRQHKEKLIPKAITNALAGRKIPVYGKGLQVRDWIYVLDHCSALELILRKGEYGSTYLIGANQERRNIDVVRQILRELGKPESLIEYVKDRAGHDPRYAIDAGKIKEELGWRPKYSFNKALRETIKWYVGSSAA